MLHFKRFSLVISVAALSFAPAALAEDAAAGPSVLDQVLTVLLDIVVPDAELNPEAGVAPLDGDHAGPQVVYVG